MIQMIDAITINAKLTKKKRKREETTKLARDLLRCSLIKTSKMHHTLLYSLEQNKNSTKIDTIMKKQAVWLRTNVINTQNQWSPNHNKKFVVYLSHQHHCIIKFSISHVDMVYSQIPIPAARQPPSLVVPPAASH